MQRWLQHVAFAELVSWQVAVQWEAIMTLLGVLLGLLLSEVLVKVIQLHCAFSAQSLPPTLGCAGARSWFGCANC